MKLQTTCASDKAVRSKVSVKEKVSEEMSISAKREESQEPEGEKVRQEKEKTLNPSKKDHATQYMRNKEKQKNELSMNRLEQVIFDTTQCCFEMEKFTIIGKAPKRLTHTTHTNSLLMEMCCSFCSLTY